MGRPGHVFLTVWDRAVKSIKRYDSAISVWRETMMEPRDNSSCMTGDGRVIQLHLQRGSKHSKSFKGLKDTQRTQRGSKGLKGGRGSKRFKGRGRDFFWDLVLRCCKNTTLFEMLQKYNRCCIKATSYRNCCKHIWNTIGTRFQHNWYSLLATICCMGCEKRDTISCVKKD